MWGCELGWVFAGLLQSKNCRLANLPPKALVRHQEEAQEFGGYFIVNGNEKLVRMLIMPRRNYVSGVHVLHCC